MPKPLLILMPYLFSALRHKRNYLIGQLHLSATLTYRQTFEGDFQTAVTQFVSRLMRLNFRYPSRFCCIALKSLIPQAVAFKSAIFRRFAMLSIYAPTSDWFDVFRPMFRFYWSSIKALLSNRRKLFNLGFLSNYTAHFMKTDGNTINKQNIVILCLKDTVRTKQKVRLTLFSFSKLMGEVMDSSIATIHTNKSSVLIQFLSSEMTKITCVKMFNFCCVVLCFLNCFISIPSS